MFSRKTDMALSSNQNKFSADIISKLTDQQPIIQISGKEETIGRIINCNLLFCKLFGYLKEHLIGASVGLLMPSVFAEHHADMLLNHLKSTEGQAVKTAEISVVAMGNGGYIFPAWLKISSSPNIEDGIVYIGTFEIERQHLTGTICYVLLDMEHKVIGISSNAVSYLRLSIEIISKCKVPWMILMPDMFQSGMIEARFYGEGAHCAFYFPQYNGINFSQNQNETESAEKQEIQASPHNIVLRCKATECTMKGIGKLAILLTLDLVQHVGKLSSTYILREGKEKSPLTGTNPISIFNYSYTKNMYLKETKARSAMEEPGTANYKGATFSLRANSEEKGQNYSRSSSLFKKGTKSNLNIAKDSLFNSKKILKNKKNFYTLILSKFQKEFDQNPEVYANMKDLLMEKEKRNACGDVDTFRVKPDTNEYEKIPEDAVLTLFDDSFSSNAIDGSDDMKRRKLQEEVNILAQVELENKKNLQNTMHKFINLKLIKFSVLAILLIIVSILICAILKFIFFRQQYAQLTSLLDLSESQSILVPDFLYCFLHLREIILCNTAGVSNLCLEKTQTEKLSIIYDYLSEIFTAKMNLRIYQLDDTRHVTMYYPAYGMAKIDYNLRDAIQYVNLFF